ncbi:Translation factor GUF1, chloroplastic [Sesamum angolense]|uniref:Translation factor GUF1 homolog, mitochondrial n=1 Tax=Sesamum angolense TaxID=2727404 RepID=A0AAE1XF70_9LAMI|nr:Translation factor GUF1, chloroplastic [Sesamum angolense]
MAAAADFCRLNLVSSSNTPNRLLNAANFTRPGSLGLNEVELQFHRKNYLSTSELGLHQKRRRGLRVCCQAAGAGVQPKTAPSDTDLEFAARVGKDRLLKVPSSNIRNFCIIAHIDHGKSTLADKLLQMTGTVESREMKAQFLDNMDLERERGITIKLQAARMRFMYNNEAYCLNLIDTPGHVDFSYEVSRSLAACEGALLVVDASQGVEAQTLANVYLALENDLEIIPVLNKIDLPGAEPERVSREIEEVVGLDCSNAIYCSAKEGIGINEILSAIVQKIPPPQDTAERPLRALIFDSYYDAYRGVIVYFRVIDGTIRKGDRIMFMASKKDYYADEVGVLSPNQLQVDQLYAGEVGYLSASIRSVADARVGDTITHYSRKAEESLSGYKEATPMVFCGLFPVDADQFNELRDALEKLQLNDAALKVHIPFQEEFLSQKPQVPWDLALDVGFLVFFIWKFQERLEREYNLSLITTAPSVVYRVNCVNGDTVECSNPSLLPEPGSRRSIEEPFVKIEMLTPKDYIGALMELAQDRRGEFKEIKFITEIRASIIYELPLAEMVGDFFDQLKSRSKGYASMEYSFIGLPSLIVIWARNLNCFLIDTNLEYCTKGSELTLGAFVFSKLCIHIVSGDGRACIGSKVIASEAISAIRKDVLAKCYGGDITRKKKLLRKQAEGKKRMKAIGRVDVPQEAFMAVLKLEKEVL